MQRYIVTADIHVTIKKDIPEQWQTNRYELLFKTLIDACLKEGAGLIIAGDLFDKAHPTLLELQLVSKFFWDLSDAEIHTYVIAGNHETISKGMNTFKYLKYTFPPHVTLMSGGRVYSEENSVLHFLSHCDLPSNVGEYTNSIENFIDDCGYDRHILISHFRTTVGEYVREEIDTEKLCKPFCLVVAGDIHSDFQNDNLIYCNQPINSAFASKVDTGYLLLTLDAGNINYRRIPTKLPSLIQWNRDAEDYAQVCSDIEDHFKHNIRDMGLTDFLKVNLSGTLKELRNITVDAENVKINKIPIVEDTVIEELPQRDTLEIITTDMQLIEYLKAIPYNEENIHSLLEIWKEVVS